jgi:hypothetical protein
MTKRLFAALGGVIVLSATTGCEDRREAAAGEPAGIQEVRNHNGVSFTRTSDGCVLSLIYDAMTLEWLPAEARGGAPKNMIDRLGFTIGPEVRGKPLRIDVRGASFALPEGAKLTVRVGDIAHDVPLKIGDDEPSLYHRVEAILPNDAMGRLSVEGTLPASPAGQQARLDLDSLDIGIGGGPCRLPDDAVEKNEQNSSG